MAPSAETSTCAETCQLAQDRRWEQGPRGIAFAVAAVWQLVLPTAHLVGGEGLLGGALAHEGQVGELGAPLALHGPSLRAFDGWG